jgi:O-antigen ligase
VCNLQVKPALRWTFYLFVALLPLEGADFGLEVSAARVSGLLLLGVALFQPRIFLRRPPAAMWCFLIYLYIYAALGSLQNVAYHGEVVDRILTLLQLLLLFWVSFCLMHDQEVTRRALMVLAFSCVLLAVFQTAGGAKAEGETGRITTLGQNPNEVAGFFSLGLLALLGQASRTTEKTGYLPMIVWPCLALLALAVVQTGSRGGAVGLGAGLATFALGGQTLQGRLHNMLLLIMGMILLVGISLYSDASRRRWERTLTTGDMTHREKLYPAAWAMFFERPIEGWGPATHLHELGWRTAKVGWNNPSQMWRDTHSLLLYTLTATGLLGTIPFLLGMWLCIRAAWRARLGTQGLTPLAMMVCLLGVNISGTWMYFKCQWLVLAYALASAGMVVASRGMEKAIPRDLTSRVPLPAG